MLHHCDIDLEYLIDTVFSIFDSCFPRTRNRIRASSPDPEAQEGELENLLVGSNGGWDDSDGVIQTPRILKERQARGARPTEPMKNSFTALSTEDLPPSYESHLPAPSPSSPGPSTFSRTRPVSGYSEFEHEIDDDARSLSLNPAKLAEMAKHFEPTLTWEDIRREEAEQAEREMISSGNEIVGSRGSGRVADEMDGDEEEFGDFEQGEQGEQTEVTDGPIIVAEEEGHHLHS
ncbi:hypothetical protein I302_105096 [Kwoniella bestiolae CBS 10118]|uniref:Uncharacterized protein n=1 Tax=Kwoniella bestiolae CBS 10118 TaxID=1296100 RepID=A0A1B9FS63_9TREE|nr:hypothetical protein I302_08383 [Kwoniella bestiolae CBS 10118]OCF21609.1 hypothetical protein I302_08383 [Kwoniella bestiolae CBS 10118]